LPVGETLGVLSLGPLELLSLALVGRVGEGEGALGGQPVEGGVEPGEAVTFERIVLVGIGGSLSDHGLQGLERVPRLCSRLAYSFPELANTLAMAARSRSVRGRLVRVFILGSKYQGEH
jgi:hypothetical protein